MKRGIFAIVSSLMLLTAVQLLPPEQAVRLVVNTRDDVDDGVCDTTHCSLREAINASNASEQQWESISFNLPGSAPYTIQPNSALPAITNIVTVDGTTQRGYTGAPLVEISGVNAGAGACGLEFRGLWGGNTLVRGLVINRFAECGIYINGSSFVRLNNNYIGTDATGKSAAPNGIGVAIFSASRTQVGGLTAAERNIISGNAEQGIYAWGDSTVVPTATVTGNYIGTDVTGTAAVPNLDGIVLGQLHSLDVISNVISGNQRWGVVSDTKSSSAYGAGIGLSKNLIGVDASGTKALGNGSDGIHIMDADSFLGGPYGAGNVISGNKGHGIYIFGYPGHLIYGNFIGTDWTGTLALGNAGDGIYISEASAVIGDMRETHGNVIAFNGKNGIYQYKGSNKITGNRIFANGALGIEEAVYNNTWTPVLKSAVNDGSKTTITGTVIGEDWSAMYVHFFASSVCDASGYGEGERLLGEIVIQSPRAGENTFRATLPAVPAGQVITATAGLEITSEFSNCMRVTGSSATAVPSVTPTPTRTPTPNPSLLSAPILIAPANTSMTSRTPTFSWQAVTGASAYRIYLAIDPGFTQIVSNQSVTATSYTRTSLLSVGQTYYWKVRATKSTGSVGPWSQVWSFNVSGSATPTNTTPTPTTPVATATPAMSATPAPTSYLGAGYYEDNHPLIAYTSTWSMTSTTRASGGSYQYSWRSDAKITFRFSGSTLTLIRRMDTNRGDIQVCIDGACQTVSNHAATTLWQQSITFAISNGIHQVEIRNVDTTMDLDAIRIE